MSKINIKRISARAVDAVLFLCAAVFMAGGQSDFLLAAAFILISAAGEIVLVSVFGGSIGKLILGLRIRTIGRVKIGALQAIHRTFAVWVAIVWAFIVSLIPGPRGEPTWPFGSKEASWDEICETTVVDMRQP
ncbi:MAG: RDD family protein [Hyphomicrobiaceae bacterium]